MLTKERLACILYPVNLRHQVHSALRRHQLTGKGNLIQKAVGLFVSFLKAFFINPVLLVFRKISIRKEGLFVCNEEPKSAEEIGAYQHLQVYHLNKKNYLFVECLPVQRAVAHFGKSRYASSLIK